MSANELFLFRAAAVGSELVPPSAYLPHKKAKRRTEGYQIKEFTIFLWPAFSQPLSPLHLCSDWSEASFTPTEIEQVPIFLHLGSDWSEACFTPTETEHVLNSAMFLQHAFGPQAKICRTHHTLPVLGFKQQFSQGCKECGLDFSAEWQRLSAEALDTLSHLAAAVRQQQQQHACNYLSSLQVNQQLSFP